MGEETLTYISNKDGTISVKDSKGEDIRYAKEADLLAIKGSAETAATKAGELQKASEAELKTSKETMAAATTNFDETNQKLLRAEAEVSTLKEKVEADKGSTEELTKAKQDLENATKGVEELTTKALEYRRSVIVTTFGISADVVKDKTMEQLDHFEEALKAVAATKGIGNFAVGGGGGGAGPVQPIDRAKAIIAAAMERRAQGYKAED